MASFFEDLWQSIFTAGPTPTLLLATNVTFACLQLVLLALLVATYSIHFVILSFISAGLWWSINWFASELQAVQAEEEAKEKERQQQSERVRAAQQGADDSETEVEAGAPVTKITPAVGSQDVEAVERTGTVKLRPDAASSGTKSSASTEDEWEKVSGSEQEKDK